MNNSEILDATPDEIAAHNRNAGYLLGAAAMRSLCVETVRGLLESEVNGHSRGAYQRAIAALESVTLEAAANETREDGDDG